MNDLAGLQALVEDVGSGNVIDAELLDGCPVEAHELDEMDASQAAQVAAHCFGLLFDHKVEQLEGIEADLDAACGPAPLMALDFRSAGMTSAIWCSISRVSRRDG